VALDDPGPVVGLLERVERLAQLLDAGEAADPQQVEASTNVGEAALI
jgi:hypothetical protein